MQVFLNREDRGVLEDGRLDEEGLSYIEGSGMWKRGEGTGKDWWGGIKTGREEEEAKGLGTELRCDHLFAQREIRVQKCNKTEGLETRRKHRAGVNDWGEHVQSNAGDSRF